MTDDARDLPQVAGNGLLDRRLFMRTLALGAAALALGRPYLWGLGTFGQEGVETVLDILTREFEIVMRQAGTRRISDINRSYIA